MMSIKKRWTAFCKIFCFFWVILQKDLSSSLWTSCARALIDLWESMYVTKEKYVSSDHTSGFLCMHTCVFTHSCCGQCEEIGPDLSDFGHLTDSHLWLTRPGLHMLRNIHRVWLSCLLFSSASLCSQTGLNSHMFPWNRTHQILSSKESERSMASLSLARFSSFETHLS